MDEAVSPDGTARAAPARKPNIIWIMADDMSWGDLGCYGQTKISTPNIDRLAAAGMRFTRSYAGSTVCAPSRSCLMQGLHTGHARVRGNMYRSYRHSLEPDDVTVAEVLKRAGYATGLFGKWGLALDGQPGVPNLKGFDSFFGYLNQRKAHSFYPAYLWRNREKVLYPEHAGHDCRKPSEYDETGNVIPNGMADPSKAKYSFDLYAAESLEFVREHADRPFFLYLAYTPPHGPLIVPSLDPYTKLDWPHVRHKEWAAMITRADNEVGKLMSLLTELGLDEDTLVFFCSDNGYSARGYLRGADVPSMDDFFDHAGPSRGAKGDLYEGGVLVPMIARWPGRIARGVTSDHAWAFWDFMPTAAEVAGVAPPDDIDGISVLPTLLGRPDEQRSHDYLYWEHNRDWAVRLGDWWVHCSKGKRVELFDLGKDPRLERDVSAGHSDVIERARGIFREAHVPSEVWPSPGESEAALRKRLDAAGVGPRPNNVND